MLAHSFTVLLAASAPQAGDGGDPAGSSRFRPVPPDAPTRAAPSDAAAGGVAGLPFSRGLRFRTLDEYLAHLERGGAVDLPWWRPIGPGLYERVTSMRPARREVATRGELMNRYGFAR